MAFDGFCENKVLTRLKKKLKTKTVKKKKEAVENKKTEKAEKKEISSTSKMSVQSFCSFYMDKREACLDAECDSEPDRSNPLWKSLTSVEDSEEVKQDANVNVEQSVKLSFWDEIMIEYEDKRLEYNNLLQLSKPYQPPVPVCSKMSAVQYLERYIFPILCPAVEETLFKAKEWECLKIQKCRFNGLDYVAELLWNRNPLHLERRNSYRKIFDIPFAIVCLYYDPRPIYPLSWLWSKEEAIIVLQAYIRRYIVCKEPECFEMRQFWKALKTEKEEEKRAKRTESIGHIELLFNEIFDKLVADAVFEVEWKSRGCKCFRKPCNCFCKCMKWCKCCNCHRVTEYNVAPCTCLISENERMDTGTK